jgi:protoporphyrin/coproporphyrin ferrochelatase
VYEITPRIRSAYDGFLLLGFGGPEGPDEVMPFLRNVTQGRAVPEARLAEVADHYLHFGGVSPINAQCRALLDAVTAEFEARQIHLRTYWGNRNWHPFVTDTVARMGADGVRRALVLATSATGGYSGCRQYREDLARARARVGPGAAPELIKLRHFFNHPGFVGANADHLRAALAILPEDERDSAALVFTAHSVPDVADANAGMEGRLYSRQQREAARLVAEAVRGPGAAFDLAWQSRSGSPGTLWLEPDINDHLADLAKRGIRSVAICPTGFVSDHLEVLWDLDVEAGATARDLGLTMVRAHTAGTHPSFVDAVVGLVQEQLYGDDPAVVGTLGVSGVDCPTERGCCLSRTAAATRR